MSKKHTWSLDPSDAKIYLQNLLENIPDVLYFKDMKSRFKLLNNTCIKKHGFADMGEAVGKSDADVFTDEHAQQALKDEQDIIDSGKSVTGIEEKETWPDGSVTWVSTTKMPLKDQDGSVIGTFGISRDITAKKEAEFLAAAYANEIKRLNEAMEEDVRMAGELQKAFFPTSYPVFPPGVSEEESRLEIAHFNQSSGIVGGDLCSIKRITKHEAGILLCDVMGHGVRAALGTAIIRSLVEELSPIETDPGEFMTHMNSRICPIFRQSADMMFITAIYVIIDTISGKIRFASAGHPMPLLHSNQVNPTGIPSNGPKNPALALIEEFQYETVERSLDPGDLMLLYTDGTYETCNSDNEQYGVAQMKEILSSNSDRPVRQILEQILGDMKSFSGTATFEDDVCMVGLKWMG